MTTGCYDAMVSKGFIQKTQGQVKYKMVKSLEGKKRKTRSRPATLQSNMKEPRLLLNLMSVQLESCFFFCVENLWQSFTSIFLDVKKVVFVSDCSRRFNVCTSKSKKSGFNRLLNVLTKHLQHAI